MTRRLAILAVVAAAVAGVVAGASSATATSNGVRTKCTPDKQAGTLIVGGTVVIVYCGHAKLTLNVEGKISHYAAGACYKPAGNLIVAMGKFTRLGQTPLYNALQLTVPLAGDGTSRHGAVTVLKKGQKDALQANRMKVVLTKHRTRATFSGKFANPGGKSFTGSFSCPA